MKNKEKIAGLVIVIVALVAFVGSIVRFSLMTKPQIKEKVAIKEKTVAPLFTLEDLTGKEVSLADYRGKVVIIDFWATWCPPCRKELPYIHKIYEKYKDKEVIVLAITSESNIEKVKGFIEKEGYSFPVLIDGRRETNSAYHVRAIPMLFVLNREGIIQHIHRGYNLEIEATLSKEIEDLLK